MAVHCIDAAALAELWAAVPRRPVAEGATSDEAVLLAGEEANSRPRLAFHSVRESKIVKNRFHLDIISDSFGADSTRH